MPKVATSRSTPAQQLALASVSWLRDYIETRHALLLEDVVTLGAIVAAEQGLPRVADHHLIAAFCALPGVSHVRVRVNSHPALNAIRQRLQCRGAAHLRATIVWIEPDPPPASPAIKVPSGVRGHVASGRAVRPRGRHDEITIGVEQPLRRRAA